VSDADADEHNRRIDSILAPRSSTTRRQWWVVLRSLAAVPLVAGGLFNLASGSVVGALALFLCALTVVVWCASGPSLYRLGYATGSLQVIVDLRCSTPPDVLAARRIPHPADPMPPNAQPQPDGSVRVRDLGHSFKKGV